MKKKFYLICLSLVFLTMFYSCEKDSSGNGSLNITVHYHNQPVAGAKVYLKMGVTSTQTLRIASMMASSLRTAVEL